MSTLAAARAIHFAVCIQVLGASLFLGIVDRLPKINEGQRWLLATTLIAALAVLPSGLAWLTLQAAEMSDSSALQAWASGAVATLLWQSQAGTVWCVRAALAAVLATATLILAFSRRPVARWSVYLVFVIAAALFMSCAWLSHAASDPSAYRPLHLVVHSVHMLGAALWFGGLLPLAMLLTLAEQNRAAADFAVAREAARRFSVVALVAVGLIIVTGIANLMLLVGSVADASAGRFVQVLALKLVVFAAMLVLATINRQVLVPRLAVADSALAIVLLRRSVWAEASLAALVLLVIGELGITDPTPNE
jgi:putative copper resistance protein D